MRRLLLLLLTTTLTGVATTAAAAAPRPVTAEIAPATCAPGLPASARCGRATLPLDYDRPRGRTVRVWFARIPARGAARGTIVPFAGGPGGALSASAAELAGLSAASPRFDVLAVDARGTGRSTFLRCRALAGELLAGAAAIRENGRCGTQLGARRSFFTTVATALDVESIRRTLRLPAPRLLGFSYGTFLATAYLRLFPRVPTAAVLDGAFPVAGDRFLRDMATGIPRVARTVCERTGRCDPGAAAAAVGTVAAALRTRSRALTGSPQRLTESLFATVAGPLLQSGDPQVVDAIVAAAAGDDAALRRLTAAAIAAPPEGTRDFSAALGIAVQCNDYDYAYDVRGPVAVRLPRLQAALRRLPDDAFGPFSKAGWAGLGNDHPSACLRWPASRTPRSQRVPRGPLPRTPVLVLNGDLDLQTPIEGARRAAAAFPRAVLVTVPSAPHVTIFSSTCAQRIAFRFLADRRLPAPSACLREPVPLG